MSTEKETLMHELAGFIGRLVTLQVNELLQPLQKELQLVKSLQDEWVDTQEAMKITGIKQAQTLKAERERPGTALIVKFEGKTHKSPRYLRTSLLEYNQRRTLRREAGRLLVA